jgi:hypothetical protein
MIKKFFVLVSLISLMLLRPGAAGEIDAMDYSVRSDRSKQIGEVHSKKLDARAEILAEYLAKYNSPLQYHAQDFIDAADTYNVDWKLVPSIAGVESTFGKHIPGGHGEYISYNAWGWGVYGDQSLGFRSWRDGIYTVTGGLRTGYLNKGLTDPYAINRVYAASPTWGAHVTFFLNDLDKFINSRSSGELALNPVNNEAGASAQLLIEN